MKNKQNKPKIKIVWRINIKSKQFMYFDEELHGKTLHPK